MSSIPSSVSGIMSSATKSSKKVATKTETIVAPVVVTAVKTKDVVAPAVVTPVKKAVAKVSAAVVVAPVVAAVSTPEVVAAPVEEVRLETEAKSITARLLAVRETVSELISEAKRLEKKAAKVQKIADKRRRRKAPIMFNYIYKYIKFKKLEIKKGITFRKSLFYIKYNIINILKLRNHMLMLKRYQQGQLR